MFNIDQNQPLNKSALLTDLYQMTMAQGYFHQDKLGLDACFYLFFREYPFNGGYAIACGIEEISQYIENFRFSKSDIDYLSQILDGALNPLFSKDFLNYLSELKLTLDIDCVKEGSVVFPHEPIIRVCGPILQAQLVETAILNSFNFQTLIATKASRICSAANCPVSEFGLRRAQGFAGGIWASRAAVVGGCSSTSDVVAGKLFDIPVSGTHAHSWVMAFDNELDAFRAYANEFPNNCVLLVDTYDINQGIKNAITVGLEMKSRGQKLSAIRIDSGDLTWLSKTARKMLDQAGLNDCGIILSNDLDEYSIKSIKNEGGVFTGLGVGTKLITAYDQPSLGGVYKLSAIKSSADKKWAPHMKVSESYQKTTIPGVLNIRRFFDKQGKLAGDMIYDVNLGVDKCATIVDPMDIFRRKNLSEYEYVDLLKPLFKNGKFVGEHITTLEAQKNALKNLETLDETQKRTLNPHTYPVGLEASLSKYRNKMIAHLRGIE